MADSSQFHYTDGINIYRKYISFVYKSTDGGKSWQIYPTQQNLTLRKRPSAWFQMADSLNRILVQYPDTLENYDRILVTNDGWKTYRQIENQKIARTKYAFYSLGRVVIVTLQRKMFYTDDEGKNWIPLDFFNSVKSPKWTIWTPSFYFFTT